MVKSKDLSETISASVYSLFRHLKSLQQFWNKQIHGRDVKKNSPSQNWNLNLKLYWSELWFDLFWFLPNSRQNCFCINYKIGMFVGMCVCVLYVLQLQLKALKGEFPQATMWIGWVESNFTNPTVKVWADLDNPLNRSDYAKLCVSPSLDGTLPEYVISQEDNSPLTLYIDFHNFLFFLGYQ